MHRNLQAEGNVILGGNSDDDDGEDVVFEVTLQPSGDEADSDDEESDAEEVVKKPHLVRQFLSTGTDRRPKLNMNIQLQLGPCV